MMARWHTRWRWLKRSWSRSEWMVRLLGLPKIEGGTHSPGIILIQIDGLSHREIRKAFRRGEMPFLSRRLTGDDYAFRPMYSGLPSNTPAVQAELFYGVKGAVPSFCFKDCSCGKIRKMFDSESAQAVESELAAQGEALLKGGSAYSNIYTGGAREPRFCAASLGWGTSTKSPSLPVLALLALAHANLFFRALAFGALEVFIALFDAVKGIARGQNLLPELKFIPSRVGVCVLLREWITGAAKMDAIRGLPIIQMNFIGYDEQAHRRGPDSAFAHWVLKGIDDSIKRVWKTAERSLRRDYEVWLYSDHGQCHTRPYETVFGRPLREVVEDYWRDSGSEPSAARAPSKPAARNGSERIRFLGGLKLQKFFPLARSEEVAEAQVQVTDLGPVALVYLEAGAPEERRLALARRLVEEGGVPLILDTRPGKPLSGWTREGPFSLPKDADRILGDHPFKKEITPDLERLCRHPNAGDLVLMGWKAGMNHPLTFAVENGSHGGISPFECLAFFAVPRRHAERYLSGSAPRPVDLRQAAQNRLSGKAEGKATVSRSAKTGPDFRLMTYNVHSCIGLDEKHRPDRIAKVIGHFRPDIIALQELDQGLPRSEGVHQARAIADFLEYRFHFHSVREEGEGKFGLAVLSRYPLSVLRAGGLPILQGRPRVEHRGALWVEVEVDAENGSRRLQVLNTHLGLWPLERERQVETLLGDAWLGGREPGVPLVLCGDLNATPGSKAYRRLAGNFSQTSAEAGRRIPLLGRRVPRTFPSFMPYARLDHILAGGEVRMRKVFVPTSHWIRQASDHLPVVADMTF